MTRHLYKKKTSTPVVADSASTLPTDHPIAVYYRQSSEAQIGNVSTSIQTVDMIAYLKQRGWADDQIIMLDMDGGYSGTTKIDERPGMRQLFDLITEGKIKAVACQDEDRLFRDVTQIQVNIFIEACRAAGVLVLTPSMVYDFAHEQMGVFHARQFRFKSEMSAEYITSYIRGRLHRAKRRLMMEGRWAGGSVPIGYLVDDRKTLPDGSSNPNWRRYVPYEPHAEIVREYFRLFLEFAGNSHRTALHILENGPYYPDPNTVVVPQGMRFVPPRPMRNYGKGISPGDTGLNGVLTNVAYLGHWTVNDEIVHWNLHPAIVPEKVFMRAFNYLSSVSFDGTPNPHYRPFAPAHRPSKDVKRPVERPVFAGMVFSEYNGELRKAGTGYVQSMKQYGYFVLRPHPYDDMIWGKKADYFDEAVVELLKQKLLATFDPDVWQQQLQQFTQDFEKDIASKRKQLTTLETTMNNLLLSLDTLTNPEVIKRVEARYAEAEAEHRRLNQAIATTTQHLAQYENLNELKEVSDAALNRWETLNRDERRVIAHSFIDRILVTLVEKSVLKLEVHWRDQTSDEMLLAKKGTTFLCWLPDETKDLLDLVERGASQLEICKHFPTRRWNEIRNKLYALGLNANVVTSVRPINDVETYEMYLKRTNGGRKPYQAGVGDGWPKRDVAELLRLVDSGASQLDLVAAFPYRNWGRIRAKITELRGAETVVPGAPGPGIKAEVKRHENHQMYLERKAREAGQEEIKGNDEPCENALASTGSETGRSMRPTKPAPKRWKCCASRSRIKSSRSAVPKAA